MKNMKIVTYDEFLKYPPNTIFSYYKPCVFSGLHVKLESSIGSDGQYFDFLEDDMVAPVAYESSAMFPDICERAQNGEDVQLDFSFTGREGMYDKDQLYAVYSKEDVRQLHNRIKKCL